MTTEPVDPDQLDAGDDPELGRSSGDDDENDDGQDSTRTDAMGIDEDDPIDATLVGQPVEAGDQPKRSEPGGDDDHGDDDSSS